MMELRSEFEGRLLKYRPEFIVRLELEFSMGSGAEMIGYWLNDVTGRDMDEASDES